jgi:ribosomal protein L17
MKKQIKDERLKETDSPMNAVAMDDAMVYLGLVDLDDLTHVQAKALRAKKKKIVTATKKQDRRADRELTRRADRLD